MNILVTGGLGYLGYEILQRLAIAHPEARILSIGRSPLPRGVSLPPGGIHELGSVVDETRVSQLMTQYEVSHVVHAAGARTSDCASRPLVAIESNVMGTQAVMRAAKANSQVEVVLFLSTAAVYGRTEGTIDESWPIAPPTNYAVSKAAAELVVLGHATEVDMRAVVVRPGFVMGPSSSGIPVRSRLNGFVHQALREETVEVSCAERFFVHPVGELADDIARLLTAPEAQGIYHLPGCCASIADLAGALQEVARVEVTTSVDEAMQLPANLHSGRFERLVGASRRVDLEALVRHTYVGLKAQADRYSFGP